MNKISFTLLLTTVVLQFVAGQQLHPPYTCTTTVCQSENSVSSGTTHPRYQQGLPGKRGGVGAKGDKGDPCQCDVADEQAVQSLRIDCRSNAKVHDDIIERLNRLEDFPENCSMSHRTRSADKGLDRFDIVPIYPLKFIGDITPWMVNCTEILSEETDGWIPIQRRQDGGTNFYRNWESYAKGFGNRQEEFWLGLRNIHKVTTTRSCKLRIDFKAFGGRTGYAEYTTFRVADEESLFRLTISGYSGNAGDSMAIHNGRAFSTMDHDNDVHSSIHCAKYYKGPWWHERCIRSSLNGIYYKTVTSNDDRVRWYDGKRWLQPYFVEMKLFCS